MDFASEPACEASTFEDASAATTLSSCPAEYVVCLANSAMSLVTDSITPFSTPLKDSTDESDLAATLVSFNDSLTPWNTPKSLFVIALPMVSNPPWITVPSVFLIAFANGFTVDSVYR